MQLCLLPIRSLTNMAQKSKDEKQIYEHYVKPVQVIDNFEEVYKLEHRLIRSYDELYNFYKNEFKPNTFFAWDTETSSLNAEQSVKTGDLVEGKIVGYSFTQDGHIGYYVPVSHPDYSLGYKALKIFYAMICRSKLNLLYNCRFDMRFLEAMTPEKYDYTPEQDEKIYKFDLSGIKYIDVQNTVWLADTNVAMPSLKKSEKHFLGWNPPTFSETIGDESNFGYLPAEQGYRYASLDALATYHLFFKTEKYYTEAGAAAKLDNDLLYPLMRLENTPINVDHDYLQSMRGDVLKHLEDLKKYLFETAGREYNINSGRELVTIFQQLGIDTGKRTKTGIMETNIKAIEGYVASHGDSEYLNKLVEYKKLLKFDNSYLEKMLEMSEAENVAKHPIRFCYFTNKVPTGRLASGTDGKNSYFSKLNFQSLPKPHSHNYHVHKATPEQIANGEDLCGYIFNDDPNGSLGLAEGQDPHLNVRKAFCPIDNDSVVVSVDMCLESGSPVQTKRGYMGIGELKVGDDILTPDGYVKVLRVKNTGIKKLYKVNTDGQSIYCSEDHPFMINNEQVPASDINHTLVQETDNFKPYIEYYSIKQHIKDKLLPLKEIISIRDKSNYILEHQLTDTIEHAIKVYKRASVARMCYVKVSSFGHLLNNLNIQKTDKPFTSVRDQHVYNPFISSTPTSAYLLGYILGDGNISVRRDNYYTVNIASKDYTHIRQMACIFGGNIKITKNTKGAFTCWSINIVDQAVCHSLLELGIKPRKSTEPSNIDYAWIGRNFNHFIRGLIDSDGCICRKKNSLYIEIAGHESYIKQISNMMSDQWGIYKNDNIFVIAKRGNSKDKLDFYSYLYKDATIWLQRKRDKYDEWIIDTFKELPSFEMYDITIDSEDHVYLCNGVRTHNCAEELRLVANIYKEQTWIKAFNSGQDVHKSTACKIFGEENYCKEARKKAKCISGDSLLYTDMGIIKIRDVNPNRIEGLPIDVDFNISTPEGVCRCSKFIYNGNKNTIKFNMNNGATLEVTPDHLVRSDNKWVRADTLHIGDYIDFESVSIDSNNYQTIDLSYINGAKLTFSKELSYYVGAILGDGNVSRKNVYFMSEDYELIQYMSSIVKRYNLGDAHENVQKYTKTSNKPFIRLNCGAKKARDLCLDIGLIDEIGHKQFKVPDVVLKSPNDVKFAFIQGIFDTDGTISKYNGHKSNFCLDFCTKSNELAVGCMNILRSLGVSCRVCRSYNKIYKRTYYKVKLRATSARRFLELGGFKCIHKQDRLKEWCKNVSFIKEYKKHYMIESIEESNSDVYDLTIENESHSFLANGFVVHNCASFGILYGASAYGFHNQFPDMTLEECEEFIEKFKAALPSIEAGQKASVRYAKKNGFVKTYFGRPRRVKYYLNHPDRSMRSFGERTVKNTAVQGAAGDCLKLMIIRLWKELFLKYPEVKWVGSIHDEITYIIPKSILIDALKIIKKCQTIKLPDWPVQLDCDISIGKSFGELIPWFLDDETGELTPQIEEIKHEQTEEKPENKVNEYDMLLDADEYDYLQ